MSVLIKNMEMPTNCADCPLNYDQMACGVTGTRWWSDSMVMMNFDSDKERLPNCPLIEIPTPHGRLGDLDELEKQFKRAIGTYLPKDPTRHMSVADGGECRGWTQALTAVLEAKTVIKAED